MLDTDRRRRTGAAEVVFGEGKSPEQISDIIASMTQSGTNILVTRLEQDSYQQLTSLPAEVQYYAPSRLLWWHSEAPATAVGTVAVVSAGTSDMNVAEEAALLGMMTSCASRVSVVNIDNGFGAGFLANRINRL